MAETAPTRAPEPEHSQEPDTPNPVNLEEFVASLSESERSCVAAETFGGDVEFLTMQLEAWGLSILYTEDPVVECLDDESVNILVTAGLDHGLGTLGAETATCISAGLTGIDLRNILTGADEQALIVNGMLAHSIILSCLSEEEWQHAVSVFDVDVVPDDRERLRCMVEYFGSPGELARAFRPADGYLPESYMLAVGHCGVPGSDWP